MVLSHKLHVAYDAIKIDTKLLIDLVRNTADFFFLSRPIKLFGLVRSLARLGVVLSVFVRH